MGQLYSEGRYRARLPRRDRRRADAALQATDAPRAPYEPHAGPASLISAAEAASV
jgi:hypothetical protein